MGLLRRACPSGQVGLLAMTVGLLRRTSLPIRSGGLAMTVGMFRCACPSSCRLSLGVYCFVIASVAFCH